MKRQGSRNRTNLLVDHQKSRGMLRRESSSFDRAFRATSIPWTVFTVNIILLVGYCSFRARYRGIAEMTSPTDKAWSHMLSFPFDTASGLKNSFLLRLDFLDKIEKGSSIRKIRVHKK